MADPTPVLEESILLTIRKLRVGNKDDASFDGDLLSSINTALMILNQHNVGDRGFMVLGDTETWQDFLGEDYTRLQGVITYVDTYVRLQFDPPNSSYHTNLLKDTRDELQWRLNVLTDPSIE